MADNNGYSKIENIRFRPNLPFILRKSKKPRYQIGGFLRRLDDNQVTISYENPISAIDRKAIVALSKGDRVYKLKDFFDEYSIFPEVELRNPVLDEKSGLKGRLDVMLGDFIVLGEEKTLKICGFVQAVSLDKVFLSHQDPFFGDAEYSSNYGGSRQSITMGTRTFNLEYFDSFAVISTANTTKE